MKKQLNIKNDCRGLFNEEIIAAILESRNIKDVEHFLNPSEDDLIPCEKMERIDEAASVFVNGIRDNKKFFVLYDTDCDGITSGTIITRYLQSMGIKPDWYINEGKIHGCNNKVLEAIKKSNPDIVIIVDSLDATTEYYAAIGEQVSDLIILDHHDINPNIDYDKYAILVSSNRNYPNTELSGAGVSWKFCKHADNLLGTAEADNLVDLAACGILADVMNVDEQHKENRYIVNAGLNNLYNPALKKIVGGYEFDSNSVLYSVSPLLNSANRYNENKEAVLTMLADGNKEILSHLKVLKKCKERQTEEIDELLPDLIEQCENQKDNKLLFCVVETDSGISGLLATKLCDMYNKQAIVVKEITTGYAGSLRGIGVDLRALCESTECGEFNGHPMAAGVIIPYYKYDEFREKIENLLSDIEIKQEIDVDVELDVGDMNTDLVSKIKNLNRISGNGFKPIKIAIRCDEYEATTMSKGKHLVLNASSVFKFIKWNAGGLLEEYEDHAMFNDDLCFVGTCDAGYLGKDYSIRLIVDDIIVDYLGW